MTCNPVSKPNQCYFLEQDIGGIPFDDDFVREQERIEAEKAKEEDHETTLEEYTSDWRNHVSECKKCKRNYQNLNFKNKNILNQSLNSLSLQNTLYYSKDANLTDKNLQNLSRLFIIELHQCKQLDKTSFAVYKHVLETVFSQFKSVREKTALSLIGFI